MSAQKNDVSNYFSEIADTGQAPVQDKQEMQTASSHTDLPFSSRERADTGHTPTHAPHPIHVSLSTVTGMMNPPSKKIIPFYIVWSTNNSY